MISMNDETKLAALVEDLKSLKIKHPIAGEKDLSYFFRAHDGFLYLAEALDTGMIENLRELKGELDPLGLQLILISTADREDPSILIAGAPGIFRDHAPGKELILCVEKGFTKAFVVESKERLLATAAEYIELDEKGMRHLPPRIRKIIEEKCTGAC